MSGADRADGSKSKENGNPFDAELLNVNPGGNSRYSCSRAWEVPLCVIE